MANEEVEHDIGNEKQHLLNCQAEPVQQGEEVLLDF